MLSGLRPANLFRRPWKPLTFSNSNFTRIPATQNIEEETIPDYLAARYYPTRIGEIFQDRYQVVGKLGYGATSTVWLARDMQRINNATKAHPGRSAVRMLLDTFHIPGPEDKHQCLVHVPLFENVWAFLHRNPIQRLPETILAFTLQRVFLALDYLHIECNIIRNIIHTDIKADNIMFEFSDESVLADFEQRELRAPCPRKELDDRCIYISRELAMPKDMGAPVLCDFGSAVIGGIDHLEDIQPDIYRAPEVILEVPWTQSVDIWNVGCMIWDIFEGESLFNGHDPEFHTYRSRAHLAEMISLLGPPPPHLVAKGQLSHKFFSPQGNFLAQEIIPQTRSLEFRESTLSGEDKADFLRFMRGMLQWEPHKRSSARVLAQDDWIRRRL